MLMQSLLLPWLQPTGHMVALIGLVGIACLFLFSFSSKSRKQLVSLIFPTRRLKKRLRAWAFLFNGIDIIQYGFQLSRGEPFEIWAPDVRMVFASSPGHIKELDNAPDAVLSLNGAAKHMLQPMYTMNGFNWFDRRGVEGIGFVRTLRTLLTNNIPQLVPDLVLLTRTRWVELLSKQKAINGTTYAAVYPAMMDLVVLLNARSLFGEDIITDDKFMISARGYVEETLLTAEVVKLLPNSLARIAGNMLAHKGE
ncbi:hypothetical protein NUW58_g2488 [Xylaria curta]|uniref:Uncharacterized protein n=1 Tax=Xylaria curta TaxID=42375 RepID=A0ACC1PFA8_9PEZI|nr:hypothetical protein NUW58_g2488 [Xylaria curta]